MRDLVTGHDAQAGFAGAMTFNLQYDLPTQSGNARYPLSSLLYNAMHP